MISTEVGWRYLEAAPADLRVVDDVPTIDSNLYGYWSDPNEYVFGYFRTSGSVSNLYVNETTSYNSIDCTGTAIGKGESNTQLLVSAMGTEACSGYSGSAKIDIYAARLCDILKYSVDGVIYDDWFLPSKDELKQMYTNLKTNGLGGFDSTSYWSSSENTYNANYAWEQDFQIGAQYNSPRDIYCRVRPVRAF